MKLKILSQEIVGQRKHEILELIGLQWLEDDNVLCQSESLILTPEMIIDITMYSARMDVPLTAEAAPEEINGWQEAQKRADNYLVDFNKSQNR